MSTVRQGILKPIRRPGLMAGLDGNVTDGVRHRLSLDKVAEADLNWMVTERSDSQFAGLVNSWTGRCVRRFFKSRNAVFKIAFISIIRTGQFSITFLNFGSRAAEFADSVS